MSKFATVIYAYGPKNDDELELTVGDKIEVIGFEEEGWWRGRLNGRIGVFPSNFVQVIETNGSSSSISSSTHPSNKLNSVFGSKVTSKNSISSNSLNTINNNSSNNLSSNNINNNNNNNSNSNNNLIMNNTQHEIDSTNEYPFASADESLHSSTSSSERRPKPIRGVGYGDILAAGLKTKPVSTDPTKPMAMASERLSTITNNLANSIQKPIPKKPPPPTPLVSGADISSNGTTSDHAPALPPKPGNQFSSYLQQRQHSRPLPPPVSAPSQSNTPQRAREQAKVVYAYKPSNPDELTIEVGDIINVINKNIADAGWWEGELNGKIGVFPDNFVELIPASSDVVNQDWNNSSRLSGDFNQQQQQQPSSNEGKIKSVFAGTPKGFSKELESNLEKHNNPASFLSLKRNKLQQQMSSGLSNNPIIANMANEPNVRNEFENLGPLETNSAKLNHITANRAKGPSRRPPSNVLGKRNQPGAASNKRESNGKDDFALGSLPATTGPQAQMAHDPSASLPVGQNNTPPIGLNNGSTYTPNCNEASLSSPSIRSNSSADNAVDNQSSAATPKTSQRANQADKPATTSPPATKPPWMVELRKSNLEKKRDVPPSATNQDEEPATPVLSPKVAELASPKITTNNVPNHSNDTTMPTPMSNERKPSVQSLRETYNPTMNAVKSISSRYSANSELISTNSASGNPQGTESPRSSVLNNSNTLANLQTPDLTNQSELTPVTNTRPNSLLNKSSSPPTKSDFMSPSHQINSTETNGNNTNSVPSNVNKLTIAKQNNPNSTTSHQSNNESTTQNTPSTPPSMAATAVHKSPQSATHNKLSQTPPSQDKQSDVSTNAGGAGGIVMTETQYDNLVKQISKSVTNEISELRDEVGRLKGELTSMSELRYSLEAMKIELKACQSATDNQKRYIKELVNNLADERKKIASMQGEIERNLK